VRAGAGLFRLGRRRLALSALLFAMAAAAPVCAQPAAPAANDYSRPEAWLCLPGHPGACDGDLSLTVVQADGTMTVQPFKADPNAPIDCLYLYPTASAQPTGNSDLTPGKEEKGAAWVQFARFGSVCRTFAPVYRSVTLAGGFGGKPTTPPDREVAYRSVHDAWTYYMAHYNHGRPIVLIGHSQGAGLWARLLKEEIDGKPVAKQIALAVLMGEGGVAQQPFKSLPSCTTLGQIGCVIRYASFRAGSPPGPGSLFAISNGACVNPAALGGGEGVLHPIFLVYTRKDELPWVDTGAHVATPFVSMPGMLSAACVQRGDRDYLSITVHASPSDHRVHDIGGDMVIGGKPAPDWGLHGVEPNLAMGDLIEIIHAQEQTLNAAR